MADQLWLMTRIREKRRISYRTSGVPSSLNQASKSWGVANTWGVSLQPRLGTAPLKYFQLTEKDMGLDIRYEKDSRPMSEVAADWHELMVP